MCCIVTPFDAPRQLAVALFAAVGLGALQVGAGDEAELAAAAPASPQHDGRVGLRRRRKRKRLNTPPLRFCREKCEKKNDPAGRRLSNLPPPRALPPRARAVSNGARAPRAQACARASAAPCLRDRPRLVDRRCRHDRRGVRGFLGLHPLGDEVVVLLLGHPRGHDVIILSRVVWRRAHRRRSRRLHRRGTELDPLCRGHSMT